MCYGVTMIILESIGVAIFWFIWWFASAFIGDQVATGDKGADKHASSRFATVLATIPLVALFIYRLSVEAPVIYGPSDAILIFLPYLGVLTLIYQR
jgi:hypothetical protein